MSSSGKHSGHRSRMRQRFLETGIDGFQPHEIMELILFYALPRVNTNNIAHDLVNSFDKSVADILNANADELSAVKGISQSSASVITLISDLCRSYALSAHHSVSLASSADIEKYALDYFCGYSSEAILLINISDDFCILDSFVYPVQELDLFSISPRELAGLAVRNSLHRIIAVHFSPKKTAVPGGKDHRFIRFLSEIFGILEIELCDYVVCSSRNAFSMKKNGAFCFNQEDFYE